MKRKEIADSMVLENTEVFKEYKCYLLTNRENRRMVALFKSEKDRTTISYAKYLMSIHLGRILTREEEVDHINEDKTDDRIENLQVLSREENKRKHARNKIFKKYISTECPTCGKEFEKSYRESGVGTQSKGIFCSKNCLTLFLKIGRVRTEEEWEEIRKNQIIKIFMKNSITGEIKELN